MRITPTIASDVANIYINKKFAEPIEKVNTQANEMLNSFYELNLSKTKHEEITKFNKKYPWLFAKNSSSIYFVNIKTGATVSTHSLFVKYSDYIKFEYDNYLLKRLEVTNDQFEQLIELSTSFKKLIEEKDKINIALYKMILSCSTYKKFIETFPELEEAFNEYVKSNKHISKNLPAVIDKKIFTDIEKAVSIIK